jgi:predicted phage terminase large subunit-like protein
MGEKIIIQPQTGPQETFLATPADIAIFGGAAGGGKTWSILVEPLRYCRNPKFGAVIFRRSYPEIMAEGALWDESRGLYSLFGARPVKGDLFWEFPKGARISFAHLQYEETAENWKGAQIALLEFDQLETFGEQQFFYMLSRNRSVCGVRPYVRATCNPEPGWLAEFLAWWIDEDGYANLRRAGRLRWFVRAGEQLVWADTEQELRAQYPELAAKSVTFIPASVYDNKILLEKDPGYLANLQALPLIDRERLLGDPRRGGNWKIKPAAGKVFNRGWFKIVQAVPAGGMVVRRWDFAATEKELNKPDPDFTASCLMLSVNGSYYILDVTAEQMGPAEIDREFENLVRQDAVRFRQEGRRYLSRWENEPGSAGKRESWRMVQRLAGIDARGISSSGDKLTRAKPLAAQAEAGNVYLLAGPWNEAFLQHMHAQPEWAHDDIMDAAAGAFQDLMSGTTMTARSWQG